MQALDFPLDEQISVGGVGYAALQRDGVPVYTEAGDACMTGREAEELAAAEPGREWRIVLHSPLVGCIYLRQADGRWKLLSWSRGFA